MGLTKTYKDGTTPTVAVIGAGVSGLCTAIQLQRQLQLTTYTVFELESDIGGTWLSNTYPGCQSDAHAHLYAYSFAPNFEWSHKFVPQKEVLTYFRDTAKTYNIYDKIQFKTRVTTMRWHEGRQKWILHWIKNEGGQQVQVEGDFEADIVVHSTGLLRLPNIPKEFDEFKGEKWHSARWNHSVDLAGKRVGIVGTSASGAQIVPAIADKVQSLDVYARSPVYMTPRLNVTYTRAWVFLFRYVPYFHTFYRLFWYYYVDSTILLYHKLAWYSAFHRAIVYFVCWFHRFRQLPGAGRKTLRRKLTPDYELAARRIVLSDKYYPTFKKPNVRLHRAGIISIKDRMIKTSEEGSERELDVLILATGFDWISNFPIGYWTGRGGVDIATEWGESPTTYYGTCVPHAPNFYLIWGPNSGIAHHALTSNIEVQVDYAIRSISYMMERNLATMEVKQEAAEEFLELLDRRIEKTVFTTKVLPKFLNSQGKCRGFWWGSCTEFWWRMRHIHPERFLMTDRNRSVDGKSSAHQELKDIDPLQQERTRHRHLNGESRDDKGKKAPIYSLHVHPDGTRLVTGAQDAKVKIWNLEPILNADEDQDAEAKRHLCTLSLHNGAVLCVKWSNGEGKYLATGSDDMIVMIWQLDRSSDAWGGSSFGSTDGPNIENWRGVKRLAGHESDVTDVSWSPENTYLASAGLDSKIIIWDGKTFDRIITLDQHQGFVKGLTWDPVGKYLASQSDDKSVLIWRITDWEVEVEVTEPFVQSSGTTFFRRLSWSPDGGHIATANAFNGSIPVASVIARDNWKADISLVGHSAPVEVVAFNPLLFKTSDASGNIGFTSICAVGSQDRGITVWRTNDARPFVGVKELFEHSFLDLSWTPDGQSLFACSYDGTVAVLLFQSENLGEAVPAEERQRLLAKYGYERRGAIMAETPIQLELEEQLRDSTAKSRMDEIMNNDASMEGITSTFAKPSDPAAFATTVTSAALSSSSSGSTSSTTAVSIPPKPVHMLASQQSVTISSDGKKRIKPMFLGNGMGPSPVIRAAPVQMSSPFLGGGGGGQDQSPFSSGSIPRGEPSSAMPEGGFATVVVGTKRKEPPTNGTSASTGPVKKASETSAKGKGQKGDDEVTFRPAVAAPLLAVSKVRLGVPRVRSHITKNKGALECHNSLSGEQPSKIIYSQKGVVSWVDYLPSPVLLMTGNSQFSAVTCEDGGVYVYSPAGRRLLPCIMLESAAAMIECDGEYLMSLTSCGLVSSWNVIRQTAVLSSVSVAPILQSSQHPAETTSSSVSITSATVRQDGLPLLTTSSGQGFTYHEGMKTWVKVIDPWFALSSFSGSDPSMNRGTSARDPFGDAVGPVSFRKGVLVQLQNAANGGKIEKDAAFAQELLNVDDAVQSAVTLAHLENQIASARVLGSAIEFKQWLRCYAQRLADESAVGRVEELCKYLLGPIYLGGERSGWEPTILGFQKRELLRELLPVLSSNRSLQRVVKEYLAGLDMVTTTAAPAGSAAIHEWEKCGRGDLEKELKEFFASEEFLNRPGVFYKGFDDYNKKWVALMSMTGVEQTRAIMNQKWSHPFIDLYASKVTFSQVEPAPRIPNVAAYKKFLKDVEKLNKLKKTREKMVRLRGEFDRAVGLYYQSPAIRKKTLKEDEEGQDTGASETDAAALATTTPWSKMGPVPAMWFISVDIESYERDHSKILEIGWSIWDSGLNLFTDKHYAVKEYEYHRNGAYVPDRRDRFLFGETVWAPLKKCTETFQQDLEQAVTYNQQSLAGDGALVLIAHDMGSDENYLRKMGVQFPEKMIKFDTQEMNSVRIGSSSGSVKLEKLLDHFEIENYCLHNAGNDAHYTLQLYLALIRDRIANYDAESASTPAPTSTSDPTSAPTTTTVISQPPLIDLSEEIQNVSLA
ncbi:HIR complex subunit [Gryganskiella cystojenkinii]|nr:HIR complex subunit [Gryganskiella cystojenkinii]